jgi:hypothetical protein
MAENEGAVTMEKILAGPNRAVQPIGTTCPDCKKSR